MLLATIAMSIADAPVRSLAQDRLAASSKTLYIETRVFRGRGLPAGVRLVLKGALQTALCPLSNMASRTPIAIRLMGWTALPSVSG